MSPRDTRDTRDTRRCDAIVHGDAAYASNPRCYRRKFGVLDVHFVGANPAVQEVVVCEAHFHDPDVQFSDDVRDFVVAGWAASDTEGAS